MLLPRGGALSVKPVLTKPAVDPVCQPTMPSVPVQPAPNNGSAQMMTLLAALLKAQAPAPQVNLQDTQAAHCL